jgi:branched-subunit amino acid ABC-type transport system permease component
MRIPVRWILTASTFTLGMAIAIVFGYYLGNWIDAKYSTGSLFSTLLVLVAIVGGFYNMYRCIMRRSTSK